MRREEVLGLKWSAVDFDNKKLFVKHTVTKGTTINRLNVTKTAASYRYYPLTDSQVEMFRALKEKEKQYKYYFTNGESFHGLYVAPEYQERFDLLANEAMEYYDS